MEIKSYQEAVAYLTNIIELLNQEFFGGELPPVQVTIQSRRGSYAHYSVNEVWKESENSWHELNLAAEHISRPIINVIASCQHELTHHYNHIHGIKDTSGSGNFYHNSNFKATAEAHGLIIDKDYKYGWTITSPGPELEEFVARHGFEDITISRADDFAFGISGAASGDSAGIQVKVKRKAGSHKMICPKCGLTVRATKLYLRLACIDCDGEELVYVD